LTLSDIRRFQPKAWSILSRSFVAGKRPGTYLFYGRPGLGDWHLAISLAALYNCEHPVAIAEEDGLAVPCDQCRSCRQIAALNFEGLYFALPITSHKNADEAIELTAELLDEKRREPFKILSSSAFASIPVAVAREIKKQLAHKASAGVTRMVIFYQMEKMLASSADALLKLIEEPPADTVVVLTASKPESLLPTIRSRVWKIRLDRVSDDVVSRYLMGGYAASESRSLLAARVSEGSPGRAIEMLTSGEDDDSSRRAVGWLLFKSLMIDRSPDTLAHMAELLNVRDVGEAEELLGLWQSLLRDSVNYALTGDENNITNIDFAADIKKLAAQVSDPRVAAAMVDGIKNALADLRRNVHIQGSLMALALRLKAHLRAAR
jgi:DNA polymerase-3 subunit delta'